MAKDLCRVVARLLSEPYQLAPNVEREERLTFSLSIPSQFAQLSKPVDGWFRILNDSVHPAGEPYREDPKNTECDWEDDDCRVESFSSSRDRRKASIV